MCHVPEKPSGRYPGRMAVDKVSFRMTLHPVKGFMLPSRGLFENGVTQDANAGGFLSGEMVSFGI